MMMTSRTAVSLSVTDPPLMSGITCALTARWGSTFPAHTAPARLVAPRGLGARRSRLEDHLVEFSPETPVGLRELGDPDDPEAAGLAVGGLEVDVLATAGDPRRHRVGVDAGGVGVTAA